MPDWKKAQTDNDGFPTTRNGEMVTDEKLAYLLAEIRALQLRVKSLEETISRVYSKSKE